MTTVRSIRFIQANNLIFIVLLLCPFAYGKVIYVDDDAAVVNNGTSWTNAYPCLQNALADVVSGDEIWVAQGIYKPDREVIKGRDTRIAASGDREATFQLINGVVIKGGYAGINQQDPNTRDFELYETILSGDLNGDDVDVADPCDLPTGPTRAENSYRVVMGDGTDQTAIFDGFTVTGGNANGFSTRNCGGGLHNLRGSPTLRDCTFVANTASDLGGGLYNVDSSSPILLNCTFIGNSAEGGGGLGNRNYSNPKVDNCVFIGNSSGDGAGVCNQLSSPTLSNCTFEGNKAFAGGGGMNNYNDSAPIVDTCKFTGNTAGWVGGAICDSNSVTKITNCLFCNNLADGDGVIFFDNCIGSMVANCTFAGNTALCNGDAVLCESENQLYPSHVEFINCIIWDDNNETEIWNNDGSIIELTYTNIQGGQAGVYDPFNAAIWGKGNMNTDPIFVNPGYCGHTEDPNVVVEPNDPNAVWIDGDYHLKSEAGRWDPVTESWVLDDITSPCIDTGDPNYHITIDDTDLDDHPRIVSARIDMGAYEHHSDTSPDPNQVTKGPAPNGVKSLAVYEDRIGEPGLLIENSNLQMWVPKRYEEHSCVIFQYFTDGYGVMSELFGGHDMPTKFSIEHYPPGSSFFRGGTDCIGTIRYSYANLEDDYPEWNLYNVPHVVGYYEEMAHCFARDIGIWGERSVGYYETLGMMIGQETALRAAWNPHIESFINTNHEQNADTTLHYQFNVGQCNVQENLCLTRILAHAFKTEVIDKYGWDSLAAAFGEVIREGYPLRDYDRSHTWGGFLSYLGRITGTDLGAIFGGEYGLPWMISQSVEHIGADQYSFRVHILDLQGSQPVDVKLHLYGDLMAYVTTYDMHAAGNAEWFYEVTLQIDEPEGCQYAFSANDGMYNVFQAVGEPTVIHPIEYVDNTDGVNNGSN